MGDSKSWVETYRPKTLDDVVSQSLTIKHLKRLLNKKKIPHIILAGQAGNGKSSTAKAFVNDFYKLHYPSITLSAQWVFERNASQELRISKGDVEKLKNFIDQKSLGVIDGFKFVILEEADRMSTQVESALRRTMEKAPPNLRFIFTCNYVENIMEPILSRCGIFRFYPVPKKDSFELVKQILKNESVRFSEEDIDVVYTFSRGDLRKLINNLQIISKIEKETDSNLFEFFGIINNEELDVLFKGFDTLNTDHIDDIIRKNISPQNFILQLFDRIIENHIDKSYIDDVILCLEDFDKRFISRSDTKLQLKSLLSSMALIMGGS